MTSWIQKLLTRKFAIALAAVFLVLVFQVSFSGLTPIKNLAVRTTQNIAGIIGVAGIVAPNEYSDLATQFEQKDMELTQREQALQVREFAASGGSDRIALYVLIGITGLLLILLLLNFYLDWRRGKISHDHVLSHKDELTTRL